MPRSSSFRSAAFSVLALALVSACGGTTVGGTSTHGADGGVAHDAATHDAKGDARVSADAGCVESPVEGEACTPGVSTACPMSGNACCIGYVWSCSSSTGTWVKEGLGCACLIDAGVAVDAGGSDSCGGCPAGDVCVVTTSSGGPCMQPGDGGVCPGGQVVPPGSCCDNSSVSAACQPRPSACTGGLSCGCAASLCSCMCSSAAGSTLQCTCAFP